MEEFSNSVVVDGALICVPENLAAQGLSVSNYLADDEPRFRSRGKFRRPVTHFVLHETVGDSAERTKAHFSKSRFAASLIMADDGHISCHADLTRDVLWHANHLNRCSFGIEVVNPYNPIYDNPPLRKTMPRDWWTWVPRAWSPGVRRLMKRKVFDAVPKEYCLPTPEQLRSLELFVPWICEVTGIPYVFPTKDLSRRKRKISGWRLPPRAKPDPGVVAHSNFSSHSDGVYLLEHLIEVEKEKDDA